MKNLMSLVTILFAFFVATSFAQTPATSPATATDSTAAQSQSATGQMANPQEMMKQMMEMSKLNENHKLLADMDGNWNFAIKMWMNPDPNAKPQESKGTATRKDVMEAAERLGKIKEIIVQRDGERVAGFVVVYGETIVGTAGKRRMIPASAVHSIGPDAMTVRGSAMQELAELDNLPRMRRRPNESYFVCRAAASAARLAIDPPLTKRPPASGLNPRI